MFWGIGKLNYGIDELNRNTTNLSASPNKLLCELNGKIEKEQDSEMIGKNKQESGNEYDEK